MLKVQITSTETIRPSTPTPQHPSSIQLSQLDQTSPPIYTHVLLFYSATSPATRLKSSLSETLSHFYPLAGRIELSKADSSLHVSCTDEGAEFIEAEAEADLAPFLADPPIDDFIHLLPIKASKFSFHDNDPLLAVQLTTFKPGEGGCILGVSFSHLVADGASMALFLGHWANIARGRRLHMPEPRFDSALVFPPLAIAKQEPTDQSSSSKDRYAKVVIRRFVIGGRAIEKLRSNSSDYDRRQAPTRVEAVSALVWRCAMRAQGKSMDGAAALHVVNLRRRLSTLLSENSMGNLWINVAASCGWGEQGVVEESVRDAVKKVDEQHVRTRKYCNSPLGEGDGDWWIFSSWCRMPWYRIDFGWGEPAWFGCGLRDMKDVCILIDAKDGVGIEVWLWLEREEMERLERDQEFLGFVSSV